MNNTGRKMVSDALLNGNHRGELAIGVSPPITSNNLQHEIAEVFVRHTNRGENPTPTTISALAHAGLLHISIARSSELAGGEIPQLELIYEIEDNELMTGDKRLFFVDRTVVPS